MYERNLPPWKRYPSGEEEKIASVVDKGAAQERNSPPEKRNPNEGEKFG